MVFRRLDLKVVIIGVLSSVTGSLFIWSLGHAYLRATSAGLLIIWILQMAYLIYYIHKMRRDVATFLSAIKEQDVSFTFPTRRSDPFIRKLYTQFNEFTSNFRLVRKEREQEHQFFMHTIRHVGTGLLAFDENGHVMISNKALFELLNIQLLTEMSQLGQINPDLPNLLETIDPGEQCLVKIEVADKPKHLSILTSTFKMNESVITLVSFRDITRDLDKTEMEAWQKLMRVVIHEIISSVVPFRLLSSKLLTYLKPEGKNSSRIILEGDVLEDAATVLSSINKRSIGLARFAESYKTLAQVPVPHKKPITITNLFREIELYISDKKEAASIQLITHVEPEDLQLKADEQLIFQVLNNLINNSIRALERVNNPTITLKGFSVNHYIFLEVQDNGHGIPPELLDSIFIPFFTTRKDGSGIGLSLSRQIMNAHNGTILPVSGSDKGTTFQLQFMGDSDPLNIS